MTRGASTGDVSERYAYDDAGRLSSLTLAALDAIIPKQTSTACTADW